MSDIQSVQKLNTLCNVSFKVAFISSNSASLFIRRLRRPAFSVSGAKVRTDCVDAAEAHLGLLVYL